MQLGSIADQDERRRGSVRLQTDARGERAAEQLERLRHDGGYVNGHARAALGSAVSEDLLDEFAATVRGSEHVLRIALELGVYGCLFKKHFSVRKHTREDVIEIVRYAAHPPPPYCLQPLPPAKPLLESLAFSLRPPLFCDVLHRSDDVDIARVMSYSTGQNVEMFDPAIRD